MSKFSVYPEYGDKRFCRNLVYIYLKSKKSIILVQILVRT